MSARRTAFDIEPGFEPESSTLEHDLRRMTSHEKNNSLA